MLSFIGYLGLAITVAGLILILFTSQNVSIILLIVGVIILLVDFVQRRSSKRKEPESAIPFQRSESTLDQFSQDSSTATALSDTSSPESSAQQRSQQATEEIPSQSTSQPSVISSQPSESVTPEETQHSQQESQPQQSSDLEQRKLMVIRAVAGNPATAKAVLDQLAKSDDPEIRKRVAGNKMTPAGILETLSKDENQEVAHNAKATLDLQQASS